MWSTERAGAAAGLLCLFAWLGGCASTPTSEVASAPARTPIDQYAPVIEQLPNRLALSVHAAGLSARQRAALAQFVADWRDQGAQAAITLEVPAGSKLEADPGAAAIAVTEALAGLGVASAQLRTAAYDASAPGAPLVLRYDQVVAHGVDCSSRWDNLTSTNANGPSRHFGCTQAANLAVEIADAHDLIAPAASQPGDGLRRGFVLDKYRQGQTTSTPKDAQANGAVSTIVQ